MLIELQLKADVLADVIRNRLRAQPVCITDEIPFLSEMYVLDHLEILDSGRLERESAKTSVNVPGGPPVEIAASVVRVVQPVQLFVVKIRDLAANSINATPPTFSPIIKLFFRLTLKVQNGATKFCVQFSGVDLGPFAVLAPDVASDIQKRLQSLLGDEISSNLDIASIGSLLDIAISATNAGIVVNEAGTQVLLRVEVNGTSDSASAWQSFFTSSVPDHLGGNAWSLFIDKDLLVPAVVKRITKGMEESSKFSLSSSPSGTWSFAAGPRVDVIFSGEVIDACSCFFADIDVDVDVTITVALSAPKAATLQMTADIDWETNKWEVFCCVLTSVLFWPVVGAIMLDEKQIGWGEYLGGLAGGPLAVFIGALVAASNQGLGDLSLEATCVQESDKRIVCTQPVSVNAGMMGSLSLSNISALPEGPLLRGIVLSGVEYGTAAVSLQVSPFDLGIAGSCSKGFHIQNGASVLVTNVGEAPLAFCEVKVFDDPLEQYIPYVTVEKNPLDPGWVVGSISITPTSFKPEFLANPYPCKVLIKTNGGARVITFAPPQAITEQQSFALQLAAVNARVECMKAIDPFYGALGRFNPKWVPDPPPYEKVLHLWQILTAGLQPGAVVTALDEHGEALALAHRE